jgi:hypothetical protein
MAIKIPPSEHRLGCRKNEVPILASRSNSVKELEALKGLTPAEKLENKKARAFARAKNRKAPTPCITLHIADLVLAKSAIVIPDAFVASVEVRSAHVPR